MKLLYRTAHKNTDLLRASLRVQREGNNYCSGTVIAHSGKRELWKCSGTAPAAAGSVTMAAPMPGTILDIKVDVGAAVKSGQVLCILEAMKMENEIMAPGDGTVASIHVNKGASVNAGDIIMSLN